MTTTKFYLLNLQLVETIFSIFFSSSDLKGGFMLTKARVQINFTICIATKLKGSFTTLESAVYMPCIGLFGYILI